MAALLTQTRTELRPMLTLSVPIMAGLLPATLTGLVDTAMIAPLGTVPLAAAALTTSVAILFYAGFYGFAAAVGIEIAQGVGAEDDTRVSRALANGLAMCALIGATGMLAMIGLLPLLGPLGQPDEVLAIITPYWLLMAAALIPFTLFYTLKGLYDATDRAWLAVGFAFTDTALNIPLNLLLIYELGMGLTGAGLATLLSMVMALLVMTVWWRRAPSLGRYRQSGRVTVARVRRLLAEGWPVATGYLGEAGAYSLTVVFIGWLGATALAASQIMTSVAGVFFMLPLGMATAVSIRVGQAIGAGARHRLRAILLAAAGSVTVWMTLVMVFLLLFGQAIARLFSDDAAVIALVGPLFVIVALVQVFDGVQSTALGALRGMFDTRVPMAITLFAYWGLALPLATLLAFPLGFGVAGVWAGYGAGLAVAATLLPWRFWQRTRV